MAKLIILGSSNEIPGEENETTHLAVVGREEVILIDCSGTPVVNGSGANQAPVQSAAQIVMGQAKYAKRVKRYWVPWCR